MELRDFGEFWGTELEDLEEFLGMEIGNFWDWNWEILGEWNWGILRNFWKILQLELRNHGD